MDRRTLLKAGGMAVVGLGLGGCANRRTPSRPMRPPVNLVPVHVSWDRVIHTTVGLRPHRPSGFFVRTEKLDHKTVIHNYGHGRAGISLSWGTSYLAADMAMGHPDRRAAVIGSGAVGVVTARQLQRRGIKVTIYAMAVPPNTTSNMAWAGFTPTSDLFAVGRRTPQWDEQFRFAAEISYRQFQLLAGRDYGVSWIDNYSTMDEMPVERIRRGARFFPSTCGRAA